MKIKLKLAITSILIIGLLTLSGCLTRKSEFIIVPDIRGKTSASATEEIKKIHLIPQIREGGFYTSVPEGYVASQSPYPFTKVKKGRTVYIEISKGISKVIVPNIVNLEYSDGKKKIYDLGLKVGKVIELKDTKEDIKELGFIVEQDPPAGTEVFSGTYVSISVSIPGLPIIPYLIDVHFEDAKKLIADSGFKLGNVIFKENNNHPRGVVIQQEPIPNSNSQIGAIINLIINEKP